MNAQRHTGITGGHTLSVDHLLLNVLQESESHAVTILLKILNREELEFACGKIEQYLRQTPILFGGTPAMEKRLRDVSLLRIENTLRNMYLEMLDSGQRTVHTGHFLLTILKDERHLTTQVLGQYYGITYDKAKAFLAGLPAEEGDSPRIEAENTENQNENTPEPDETESPEAAPARKKKATMLEQFGTELTRAAAEGKLDPVIGRDREIERLIQVLGRRKKNNPILIGEAGVGKSAIVEGLALRIAEGKVPHALADKRVYSFDVATLVAGTKYRGEFEERMKALLEELSTRTDAILFIDEIHTIVGAGSTSGSLDTANILKPALARGELQCIGATTLNEYRGSIESDGALERRFQKILVEPTSKEDTLAILQNIRKHYEEYHRVAYTAEALAACVELTDRYVTDRHFPDKAIDVLDEAGSKAHVFGVQDSVPSIDRPQIEAVVAAMTGIPSEKISIDEKTRLKGMSDALGGAVIGQSTAVTKLTKAILRSRAGLKDPKRPIGTFLFVGPTGVGKTHLAKELARFMFDRDDALIRIDMSEYSEKHNVSRLIGSPPGYVGYGEGGQLTEQVRRHPYSVVLFDEIEKAHPDVFNIMLQIFDDGHLTDGQGRKVDFRNCVLIMTSNVGSREVSEKAAPVGFLNETRLGVEQVGGEDIYRKSLSRLFAPEFINRIDDIVIFNTLSDGDIRQIVELEFAHFARRARALGYRVTMTAGAKDFLARVGYEPHFGVRSLRRALLEHIEEPFAEQIVTGELTGGAVAVGLNPTKNGLELKAKAPRTVKKSA
jgi:ATP-dependent Clp protease ATP-binding subunit ClpC